MSKKLVKFLVSISRFRSICGLRHQIFQQRFHNLFNSRIANLCPGLQSGISGFGNGDLWHVAPVYLANRNQSFIINQFFVSQPFHFTAPPDTSSPRAPK